MCPVNGMLSKLLHLRLITNDCVGAEPQEAEGHGVLSRGQNSQQLEIFMSFRKKIDILTPRE